MIATIIFALSVAALVEFFVSYCRSLIASAKLIQLSEGTRELAAIPGGSVPASEYMRLTQLARACPELDENETGVFAVRIYFGLLTLVASPIRRLAPVVAPLIEGERSGCAYFAAAALDHRIANSRRLYAQQATGAGL
jgi:hypothetical protein